jgi:ABC-type transporter Mla MlaB component
VGKHMAKKKAAGRGAARQPRPPTCAAAQPATPVAPKQIDAVVSNAGAPAGAACSAGPLALGSALSIREVGERAAQIKAMFATGAAEVDARMLESVDTAGLQLLLAAAAEARRRGLKLKLLGAERLNTGAASALGVAEHLAAAAEILP